MMAFWKSIIAVLTGAIGLGALGWLLKLVIEKLVAHSLERRLVNFKHDQNLQIEELRAKLHHFEDRGIRSNEREYQALILVWEGFVDAYHATHVAIVGFHPAPDMTSMADDEVDEWLSALDIWALNKKYIKGSTDRNKALSRVERARQLSDCQTAIWNGQRTLRHQAIFIPEEIERLFDSALAKLRRVWAEQQVGFSSAGHEPSDTLKFLDGGGENTMNKLRITVKERVLHDGGAGSGTT